MAALSSEAKVPAIVISDLGGGGTQRVALRLAEDWVSEGYDVKIITLSRPEDDMYPLPPGVERVSLDLAHPSAGLVSAIAANVRRVVGVRRALRRCGATAAISFLTATNVVTLLATAALGIPVVVSERNDPARQKLGFGWSSLRHLLYRRADLVTANSQSAVRTLERFLPLRKLMFVPNPIPDWTDPPAAEEARAPIVLAVGRLHVQKRHDRLIRTFAASRGPELGWKLVILGEGNERVALESLVRELGVDHCVDLPGHATEIRAWYERASLFALLSDHEGMPNTVIEAATMGLPVLVTDTCGDAAATVERLECGFVADSVQESEISALMNRLISDAELRAQLGQKGRSGIIATHSPEAVNAAWQQVMKRIEG